MGRDSLSLLCESRRVSGAGKFTGRHKTYGAFRDAPALTRFDGRRNPAITLGSIPRKHESRALRAELKNLVRQLCANVAESYETSLNLANPSDAFGGFRVLWCRALVTLADAC